MDISVLGGYLDDAHDFVMKLYNDSEKRFASMITRTEITQSVHFLVLSSIRKIRSFNFSESLVTSLGGFLAFLSTNPRESPIKFNFIIESLKIAEEKLQLKFKNDPNLKDNEDFKENFRKF